MATTTTPDTPSSDYSAMKSYWDQVATILGGAPAMRQAGSVYLPQFPNETEGDYEYRRENAKFTNIYADIVTSLTRKPFAEEVTLADGTPERIEALAEDIDGRGNNLHVFAAETFFDGLNDSISWVLVDYTETRSRADGRPLTIAEERRMGVRPYWVRIPASRMLAVYTDVVDGAEVVVHARVKETTTRRDGFDETAIERVRVFDRAPIYAVLDDGGLTDRVIGYGPATFRIYERQTTGRKAQGASWQVVSEGPVTLGVIPLVPFITGKRKDGGLQFIPPLQGVADLQIEHYQQETALKSITELTAFPMLSGNGVQPPMEGGKIAPVPVGPRSVLYAPPNADTGNHGEWAFIEPSAESLKFLAEQVDATENQMRELGRQPLSQSAGITVVAAASASQKASSVIQAWALGLKDCLEQCLKLTADWLSLGVEPEVSWNLDDLDLTDDDKGPATILDARKNGDISQETLWTEFRRRGILSADFDADEEKDRLEAEAPSPDEEADLLAAANANVGVAA
jgi:hypothetical protein